MPKYELNSTNLIAENERRGSARDLFWPWCGANVSLLALSYGSFFLGFGISFWQATFAAIIGTAVMIIFIAAIASVWARGILIDCGCFGGGGEVDPSKASEAHRAYLMEILRDLGLALTGAYLYFFPYGRLSIEKPLQNIEEQ